MGNLDHAMAAPFPTNRGGRTVTLLKYINECYARSPCHALPWPLTTRWPCFHANLPHIGDLSTTRVLPGRSLTPEITIRSTQPLIPESIRTTLYLPNCPLSLAFPLPLTALCHIPPTPT